MKKAGSFLRISAFLININKAYTLVELLAAIAVFAVVSVAGLHVFEVGIKLWNKARSDAYQQGQLHIFLEKLEDSVDNKIEFSLVEFDGSTQEVSFCVLKDDVSSGGEAVPRITKVMYYFDPAKNEVFAKDAAYSDIAGFKDMPGRQLASGITRMKFSYLVSGPETKTFEWLDSCREGKNKVSAVRVELTQRAKGAAGEKTYVRSFVFHG